MKSFIGIDVGTSGTKSVLFSENGEIISSASCEYELIQPKNGWTQQHPEDWKNAVLSTLKELSQKGGGSVCGIGVSGQMHGLVILDENDVPLMDSIIWCDQRTGKEVDEICDVIGRERYIELTCNAPNTSFTLSKLLWVKNNKPDIYKKINKILLPKDYINFCLTGKYLTDVSDASGTGYFSVIERRWCKEILSAFNIDENLLPTVFESCEKVGSITKAVSDFTGLKDSVIVCAGAGDQAAAALGNGIVSPGDASISLGTSGVVYTAINDPIYDRQGRIHTFCHSVPNTWNVMGVTQGCGLSVSWFKQNFADQYTFDELNTEAEKVTSDGIIFLPYLMGERTPHMDPDCRGAFIGLSAGHNVFNLYRAVLEGVCMSIKDCDELIRELKLNCKNISICGGGTNSEIWLEILVDVLKKDLSVSDNPESGAKGVAMLSAVACGKYENLFQANKEMNFKSGERKIYHVESSEKYDRTYVGYKKLYYAIKKLSCGVTE